MKRMIVVALSLVSTLMNAQVTDTLRMENPSFVEVISSPGSLSVTVDGTAQNPEFHYSNSVKADPDAEAVSNRLDFETPFTQKKTLSHWKLTLLYSEEAGVIGGIIGGKDLFGDAKMRQVSADLGIIGVRYYPGMKNNYISFGWHVGYSLTRRLDIGQRFMLKDGNLLLTDYPTGSTASGKSADIWRLRYSFPLQYTLVFGKRLSWRAATGTELHWNALNYLRSQYDLNGNHVTEYVDNSKPNPVSLDVMASLSYRGIGIRVRYCPIPAFSMPNGPEYRTWSIGFLVEY